MSQVKLPANIRKISDRMFAECWDLAGLVIPEGVAVIGDYSYSWCVSLTRITLPNSVATILKHAFDECRSDIIFTVGRGSYAEAFFANTNYAYEYLDESTSC